MSLLLSALLLQIGTTTPEIAQTTATPPSERKTCRDMLLSSSRLGAVRVCKTRAQWRRWEMCNSATRYCDPPRKETVTVASLPGDKLICKYIKETGSRIGQQKVCATRREWQLSELETQETIRNRQSSSTLTGGAENPRPDPGAGGPR